VSADEAGVPQRRRTTATSSGFRPLSARTWADIAVLLVLALLGVIGFEPSFGGYSFLIAGLGGLALGAATGILTSMARLGAITTALVALVAYFVIGTAIAVPQQGLFGVVPTLQSLDSLAVGSVYGWADIVTLRTPVGAPQYIAVVPYVATWLVALVSTTLATRWLSSRPRTAWRFAVTLVGPIALYLSGILIGTSEPYQAGIRGAAFAVIALVWLGWRRPNGALVAAAGARRLRNRKLGGTAAVVAVAVLLGGGAGFVIAPPNSERFVLREEVQPPFDPLQYPSPLSGFRHYTKAAVDEVLFTVSGLQKGDTIRLATMDSFTGKLWDVTGPETETNGSGSFSLVGRTLPKQSFITPEARRHVMFTIKDYQDVWLPSIGYPTALTFESGTAKNDGDDLRYNEATGTAVLTTGLHKGDSYQMNALVQKVLTPDELANVQTAAVQLPPVVSSPDIVTSKAQDFAGKATTPIAQLEAIRNKLVTSGFLSHGRASDAVPSRAGHGADRINDLLERTQMVGDQEQYSSAFALMARSLGYPARVVMGFAPKIADGQGTVKVTGNDVTAWVEVAFAKDGWVAFNPTPKETDIPQAQLPQPQSEPQPQVRQPPRSEKHDDQVLTPVSLDDSRVKNNKSPFAIPGWVLTLGLSVFIPALLFFGPLLVIAGIKERRRKKRRDVASGDAKAAGAWDEMLDRYSELGFAVPGKTTRVHIADELQGQLPDDASIRLRTIAVSTDDAVFSGLQIDEQRSDAVWTEALAAVELAREAVSGTRRLLSWFRVRSARDWATRMATTVSGASRASTASPGSGRKAASRHSQDGQVQ
jgi:transglutaminase-like putative cysteine protease